MTMYGNMDLVLDPLVEEPGRGSIFVVVDGRGVNVGNFLVRATLTETDFPDFSQQVLKIARYSSFEPLGNWLLILWFRERELLGGLNVIDSFF